jgi:hypothetical protein
VLITSRASYSTWNIFTLHVFLSVDPYGTGLSVCATRPV